MNIFHIRRKLSRNRGNQYYLDRSTRCKGTFCDAEPTSFDISHKQKAEPWSTSGIEYEPCSKCVDIREATA